MRITLPRQVHGKYGTLFGTVDLSKDERYATQLIAAGLAKVAPKKGKAK